MARQEFELTEQRKAARDQETRMTEQRDIMQRQLRAMQKQGKLIETQIDQSDRHYEKTYRPALGMDDVEWRKDDLGNHLMEPDKYWTVNVFIKNFGNAPAVNVEPHSTLRIVDPVGINDPCPEPVRNTMPARQSRGVHPVQARRRASPMTIHTLSEWDIADIEKGRTWLMLFVEIKYESLAGTKYTYRYHSRFALTGFDECGDHNYAD